MMQHSICRKQKSGLSDYSGNNRRLKAMGVDSKKILSALKTGDISIEYAESELLKIEMPGFPKESTEKSRGDFEIKKSRAGYHRVITERPGTIDDVRVVESKVPELKSNQVRIAVKAFSLNFADLLCIKGLYPTMPPYPFTPGLEVSGIVVNVGDAVKSVRLGDHVIGMAGKNLGGHANMLTCPANRVFHKPASLSFEEACALPVVAITMIAAFDKARVKRGEKILIQTATGGTGLIAVQLAKYYGAKVFATAGADHKLDYLEKINIPYRINYLTTDFEKEIDRLTHGDGVDVVINTLPGDAIQKGLNCLSSEGRYIELAMTAIKSARTIDLSGLSDNQTFYSIDPGRLKKKEIVNKYCDEMLRWVQKGVLRATVCKIFPFDKIKDAYRYMENRKNIGKIVVGVPDEYTYGEMSAVKEHSESSSPGPKNESIAVIGMSGRFAGADNLSDFWENLSGGKDSVVEVPEDRWDAGKYFDPNPEGCGNKTNCKWGGFLENIDKFDPLFFNISPAEAEHMDPQQRLFLEESWKAMEDAGYSPTALSGRKCGVFVGVGKGDYRHGPKTSRNRINAHHLMGSATSILAARISYILNLTGPSIAMDTACSSSLVAIHQACQSIINGDSEMALAGGVCLLTTEELFIMAGKAGMLSPTGRCRTFDNSADGFVAGEGVGVLLLKPLKKAIEDGDCIHGVIKGGGINQDGKTNGITAPSAKSQIKLEKEVYNRYGINPESISYVEAHGTGTKLGDPIEVSALSEVFGTYTDKKRYCAIGSVKTNIGHALAAAGVASVIKVILALNQKKIPPSINFTKENEHINFKDSPFYVNTELTDWKADGDFPLRAVVSSFGFSGTNAHVVIEEHKEEREAPYAGSGPVIFVLSAKNEKRLKAYADKMETFLQSRFTIHNSKFDIADVAYTSQVGREAMEERLAVVVNSLEELGDKLRSFTSGDENMDGLHRGSVERNNDTLAAFAMDEELQEAVRKWIERGKYSKLLSLWVNGLVFDWDRLYGKIKPRRISLPTYPFAQERYWIDEEVEISGRGGRLLHPLLHENTSDLTEQRFSSTFTGDEFFLAGHIINGRRILPGVAYLEMARAAVVKAAGVPEDGRTTISLKNVVWARPIIVEDDPFNVHIGLFPEASGEIAYEIYSQSGAGTEPVVHGRGTALTHRRSDVPPLCVESIKDLCTNMKSRDALYGCGEKMKIAAASSFMCIKELFLNKDETEALALLELPSHLDDTFDAYGLHLSLLNGALETGLFGLHPSIINGETITDLSNKGRADLPFSLGEIEIVQQTLPKTCYAHAVKVKGGEVKVFNIQIFDQSGRVLARLGNFAARSISQASSGHAMKPGIEDGVPQLHPLIDRDASTSREQKFVKRFTGNEFYFTDHVVGGKKFLPGVAYLEMARAAVFQAAGVSNDKKLKITLKNVVWTRPIVAADGPIDVQIRLFPEKDGEIAYRICTQSDGDNKEVSVHSRGAALVDGLDRLPALDIASLKRKCNQNPLGSDECYEAFAKVGLEYGEGHRGIEKIYVGEGQALARLALPSSVSHTASRFILHPSLMDAALQASMGLMTGTGKSEPAVPFALEFLEVYGECSSAKWAFVNNSKGSLPGDKVRRLDIDLCDENGRISARMRGFSTKAFDPPGVGTLILEPSWKEKAAEKEVVSVNYDKHMVILCETERIYESTIMKAMKGVRCITLQSKQKNIDGRFRIHGLRVFEEIKNLLKDKPKGKVLIQVVIPDNHQNRLYSGLSGLLKTADLENSKHVGQLIETEVSPETIVERLEENTRHPEDRSIRYQDGKRLVEGFETARDLQEEPAAPWKEKGVYLITGGAGGLGLIFAEEIASQVKNPVLILTGRSKLGSEKQSRLKNMESHGARVEYKQADVGKKADVKNLIKQIEKEFGSLNGIIHGAGIIRDNLISKKTKNEFKEVLTPKVTGSANLDDASKNLQLDLFVMFSSGAGPLGNIGQADYACANAFMDAYAEYRNELVKTKKRSGKTLSINWPLWKEGGMQVDEETEKMLKINLGMTPLRTEAGINAFYRSFSLNRSRALVAEGFVAKMKQKLLSLPASAQAHESSHSSDGTGTSLLFDDIKRMLISDVSSLMKISTDKIDPKVELSNYGFDSISLTELTNKLNKKNGLDLPPTLLFEYPTIEGFAKYLMDAHRPIFAEGLKVESDPETSSAAPETENRLIPKQTRSRFAAAISAPEHGAPASIPVAIVGISGKFPMAEKIEGFWNNLKEGKDCITEIPEDRWDWKKFLGDKKEKNTTGAGWGGFIDGVRDFDPIFFGISPREAELMDPQQRLIMLYVWQAMEDAGIAPKTLSQKPTGVFISPGMNEYMHIGSISQNDPFAPTGSALSAIPNRISYAFNLNGPSEYCETACSSVLVALHRAIVSIRLGECEQAVIGAVNLLLSPNGFIGSDSIGNLSPEGKAKSFQADADGYVRSEGVGAMIIKPLEKAINDNDRIYAVIKGTGVAHGGKGMSLTAPSGRGMKAAMAQAYGTSGIDPATVSYIEAHGTATPMGDAIEINTLKSGYDEISRDRFKGVYAKMPCYISSLKPCIGHAEIASGMAALIKVVMAFKNETIPGLPGFKTLNENISLKGSRFEITPENRKWEPSTGADGKELPRRAAINSYGFGGVNAHAIIEEYVEVRRTAQSRNGAKADEPVIFVLSAKNEGRLKAYAEKMAEFLEEEGASKTTVDKGFLAEHLKKELIGIASDILGVEEDVVDSDADLAEYGFEPVNLTVFRERINEKYDLAISSRDLTVESSIRSLAAYLIDEYREDLVRFYPDKLPNKESETGDCKAGLSDIAYTLQTGREAMEYRLAMVVSNKEELAEGLRACLEPARKGRELEASVPVFTGNPGENPEIRNLLSGEAGEAVLQIFLAEKNLEKLAGYWVRGFDVPWEKLYQGKDERKVSLPTYPFERRRCWIENSKEVKETHPAEKPETGISDNPGPEADVRGWLTRTFCSMLKLSGDEIGSDREMSKYGLDSLIGMRLINRIKDAYGIRISPSLLLQYETIEKLARYLTEELNVGKTEGEGDDVKTDPEEDVDLDELSESELDGLLKQHIADEQN